LSNHPQPDDQPEPHLAADPAAAPPVTPDGTSPPAPDQPRAIPSGDFLPPEPYQPPAPPSYQPGYAAPPQPGYPPTSQFPATPAPIDYAPPGSGTPDYGHEPGHAQPGQPGFGQPGYAQPGHGQPGYPPPDYPPPDYAPPGYPPPDYAPPGYPPQPPPRKSNAPLIAVVIAVALLLCGGVGTAGVMITRAATQKAREAVKPLTDPTFPTSLPELPTDLPDLPGLPTDVPTAPGGTGKQISVTYEVTGDGPAQVIYLEKLGTLPKQVKITTLPWKITATMSAPALVSVSAVRTEDGAGTISCRTLVDGKEVAQKSSSGAYGDVSCNWFVLE
jgi:MmpS family membrane protein